MSKPYTITICFPYGNPNGIRTIEKSVWSGRGLFFPRALFPEACEKRADDLNKTGVYLLIGESEDSPLPVVYVGEGSPVIRRLKSHAAEKEFWLHCVAFTAKNEGDLNKAYIKYFEYRLLKLALNEKRCLLDNDNRPTKPIMSESDYAAAEGFLQEILLCLPSLGLGMFTEAESAEPGVSVSNGELFVSAKGVNAVGFQLPNGFKVKKGSEVAIEETQTMPSGSKALKNQLISDGVLVKTEKFYLFTQDYLFSSSSAASSIILSRSSSGPRNWKNKDGVTLRELDLKRI